MCLPTPSTWSSQHQPLLSESLIWTLSLPLALACPLSFLSFSCPINYMVGFMWIPSSCPPKHCLVSLPSSKCAHLIAQGQNLIMRQGRDELSCCLSVRWGTVLSPKHAGILGWKPHHNEQTSYPKGRNDVCHKLARLDVQNGAFYLGALTANA